MKKRRKRMLCLLTALCLVPAGAFSEPASPEATESAYAPIHISLWGNPTTGYEWSCEFENNGVLDAPIQEYVEDVRADGEVGTGGTYDFYFGVRSPGRAQLLFNYSLSWDVAAPSQTVLVTVEAAEDGLVAMYQTRCYADDCTLLVVLPSNPTTGRDWAFAGDDSGTVSLTTQEYEAFDEALLGSGGHTSFAFHIEKPGDTVLMFNNATMWDPYAAADATYAVALSVDDELQMAVSVELE